MKLKKQSKDFVVCGVKTDCLMVKSNDLIEFNDLGNDLKNVIKQGIKVEDFKELNYKFKREYKKPLKSYFNNKDWIKMKNLELKSFLFIGIGGIGKNHETLNFVKDKKVLCLSFETSAVNG